MRKIIILFEVYPQLFHLAPGSGMPPSAAPSATFVAFAGSCEAFDASWHRSTENAGNFPLEAFAYCGLRRTGDEEIEKGGVAAVVKRLADEFCLADTPSARHDGHARGFSGKFADAAKFVHFHRSSKEFHFAHLLFR